jgi:HprK-related kinase A
MKVGQMSTGELARRMAGDGLALRSGPFALRIGSDIASVHDGVHRLYEEHPVLDDGQWCDFSVRIDRRRGLRRWIRPQVQFSFDGATVFEPLPIQHALPLTEWAINWCISFHAHQLLVLHAAVIARGNRAVVLPAPPGSGKSTLCAALVHRGWRLLSDELALISLDDASLLPLVRPVSLKNQSIEVIASFAQEAVFSAHTFDTHKGTVALMQPPANHVRQANTKARAAWVVFPKYIPNAPPTLNDRPRPESMLELARNAFNLGPTGREGFLALCHLIDGCSCHEFSYSSLDDAVRVFDALAQAPTGP